ncbi:ketopantoate hydroxymethyltransferase [Gymnopilus junonius]|uniref:3-methyl-2-oxobutanoate hydroxymethyltransferase n=1 Tax=Gymnopilus junonius TaxID=109634 RepID=A0A9P5NBN3_GYMJU|nr:ketopantoate hydroxymethyltransferase [Gymnopilus junonius]
MSVRPPSPPSPLSSSESNDAPTPSIPRKKVTIQELHTLRQSSTPITMITAYDYPSALACSSSSLVDITLVGDSLAQVCLGYASTTQLTLSEMVHHARAVARGTKHPFLVADMPYGSYHTSVSDAVANAVRLVQEGRVEAVKVEGGREIVDVVQRLTEVGIPVMAHVGLLPQDTAAFWRGRCQKVLYDALALEDAGAFAMVIEAVPQELGQFITQKVKIPTIGIGAGPHTSGQVLVYDDIMGTWSATKQILRDSAIEAYCSAVRSRDFPHKDSESYSMDRKEFERFCSQRRGH